MIFNPPKQFILIVASFWLFNTGTLGAREQSSEPAFVPSITVEQGFDDKIAKKLADYLDDLNKSGVGVVIRVDKGAASWRGAAGYAQLNECCKETRRFSSSFRVGSLTKLFTASVVLSLVEAGRLSLEDTLGQLFPEEQAKGGWLHDHKWAKSITLKELMGMRIGISNYTSAAQIEFSDNCTPLRVYTPNELVHLGFKNETPRAQLRSDKAPTKCHYSNTNYIILGLLIEKITQKSLADNLRERIFEPLNLNNIDLPPNPSMPEDHVPGYGILSNMDQTPYSLCYLPQDASLPHQENSLIADVTYRTPSVPWAAGAIVANMDDLVAAVKAQVKGAVPKLSAALIEQRLNDTVPIEDMTQALQEINILKKDESLNYGLGMVTFNQYAGHGGAILGYYSMVLYNKDEDIAIGVNLNRYPPEDDNGNPVVIAIQLTRIMAGATGLTHGVTEQTKPLDEPLVLE
ncbi:MAG: serine hydrolase domain-containing protein [Pseudomonadota bacterium]|nr:serine hydrolase domain-containing protein [Pseudomonadota bacterium]